MRKVNEIVTSGLGVSLADLAKETGARPVTVAEVPRGRDLVVVTIPEAKIPNLPPGLFKDVPDDLTPAPLCLSVLPTTAAGGLRGRPCQTPNVRKELGLVARV